MHKDRTYRGALLSVAIMCIVVYKRKIVEEEEEGLDLGEATTAAPLQATHVGRQG